MLISDPEKPGRVHVKSVGGPLRIALLDHRFRPVGLPAVGEFDRQAPPGLYLLQYDTGWVSRQVPIDLEPGGKFTDLEVRVPFPSAAPLPGTSGFRAAQAAAAAQLSHSPDATTSLGAGGRLMLYVRNPKEGAPAPSLAALTLLDGRLRPLAESVPAHRSSEPDGWAGWCADANPGCYVLRWPAQGTSTPAVGQPLWVSAGWSTILFLTSSDDGRVPHLQDMTVHLAEIQGGFRPEDPGAVDVHLAMELALAGWRTGKSLVDLESLDRLLQGKFANPMLGIVAAHVLLQEVEPNRGLLTRVLAALEAPGLVAGHPDVRALRAIVRRRFKLAAPVPLLDWPPMFKASFKEAIASDWGVHDVISPGSLADRAAPCLVPLSPWTTWVWTPADLSDCNPSRDEDSDTISYGEAPLSFGEACNPPRDEDSDTTADFLGAWLARVLPKLSLAERVVQVFGFDWGAAPPRELWRRFAASADPTVQKLAGQLREMYRFAMQSGGTDALNTMGLAGVAQALNLPQASVATAAIQLAQSLLSLRDPEGGPLVEGAKKGEPAAWPPPNGARFIRGEGFGRLLLQVVEELARKYPTRDFTDGAAQVFAWFDGKLKQNRRFINGRRFPTESAFRAYLRQSVWNAARMAERRRRKGQVLRALPADRKLVSSGANPQQMAALRESVETLEEPYKSVLEQFFFEGSDIDRIAAFFGKTRGQVVELYEEAIDRLSLK